MTIQASHATYVDVAGVATALIDVGPSTGTSTDLPPVLLLHGSGPGVTAAANWRLLAGDVPRTPSALGR